MPAIFLQTVNKAYDKSRHVNHAANTNDRELKAGNMSIAKLGKYDKEKFDMKILSGRSLTGARNRYRDHLIVEALYVC